MEEEEKWRDIDEGEKKNRGRNNHLLSHICVRTITRTFHTLTIVHLTSTISNHPNFESVSRSVMSASL